MPTKKIPESIVLPSGGTVTFHNPEDLTGNDHRAIMSTIEGDPSTPKVSMAMDMIYGAACALIESWDIPYTPKGTQWPAGKVPIPENDTTILGALRMPDYAAIIDAVTPVMEMFNAKTPNVDDALVPGSPTVPSGG
jgi:hypothetical protein